MNIDSAIIYLSKHKGYKMEFGIFHNDKSLASSSFTEKSSMADVALEWNYGYAGTVGTFDYHVGVMVDGEELLIALEKVKLRRGGEIDY